MSASPPLDPLARDHPEGGTVVILGAVILALSLALVAGLGKLGQFHISRAKAQLAADAAALGAAAERAAGGDCKGSRVVAENLAAANGARLESWSCSGRTVALEVAVTGPPPLGKVFAGAVAEVGEGLRASVTTGGEGFRLEMPNTESTSPFRAPEWLVRT